MKRGFIICLLVFGLTYAAEDNIGAETKDAGSKTITSNVNFRFYDKNKRGATKLTNADSPSFNHLTTSNTIGNTISSSAGAFKPSTASVNPPPFRYLYNQQQYYQSNPYLSYLQLPHATQIAAQYSLSNPVTHFLQTPNQIQYVAAPSVAQIPQIKFQSYSNDYSSVNAATSNSATSSATSSQYAPQPQQTAVTSSYVPSATSGSSVSSSAAVSQAKQVQVPFYSGYQAPQPVYYTPQPLFTYFPQAQASNFIYQQPNANFLLKQQQQHQLANLYGANRFGLYSQAPNTQLTYLVPMVVPQPEQDSTTSTSGLKGSDKTVSNTQQSASSNAYTFGTKA